MPSLTRIQNNQITDSSSGNVYLGVNAAAKVQDYSITAGKIQNNLTYGSDLTITGNLTVQGNTTTIDTVNLTVEDPLILLAKEQTGSPTLDIGYIGKRGTDTNIAFVWDESQDEFVTAFTSSENTNTVITISSYASLRTLDMAVTGNLSVTGNTSFTGNVSSLSVTGNISAGNYNTAGVVSATGNVNGGNLVTAGNVSGGNILTGGIISSTGNITTAGYYYGNGFYLSGVANAETASKLVNGTSNVDIPTTNGNVTVGVAGTNNVAVVSSTGMFVTGESSTTGNVTGGNLLTAGVISSTGNVTGGNVNTTNVSATGNVNAVGFTGGNASVTGNVYAQNFIGNISGNIDAAGSNTWVQFNDTGDILGASANFTFDKATSIMTVNGTIQGTTISATGNVIGGNVTTAGLVSATGNVIGGNLVTSGVATITGTVTAGNVATAGTVSATGNVTGGNVLTSGYVSSTGNVTGGNILTSGAISSTGTATVGNVATGGTVSATGSITGGTLSAIGTATVGNLDTGGTVSATGNITGGNVLFGTGIVSGTGNIYGGNLISGNAVIGNIQVSGDITVNSLTSNTYASIIGNVVGGNVLTGGYVSATGNVTGGNVLTGGVVSATGTATAGNLATGGTVSATGNVTGGNLITNGLATVTGTVTAGNLATSGTASATGNVTGGNVISNGIITAAGNISGNNISAAGFVSALGNIVGPTVVTSNITTSSGDLFLNSAGGELRWDGTGNIVMNSQWINNLSDPVQAQDAATKEYVDNAVTAGITIHQPVQVESPTALNATYAQGGNTYTVTDTIAGNVVVFSTAANLQPGDQLWFTSSFQGIVGNASYWVVSTPNTSAAVLTNVFNGAPVNNITSATGLTQPVRVNSGIGATLTNAGSNAALVIDNFAVSAGDRVLVYTQANAVHNGVYVVNDAGNVSAAWVMTRASDADTYGQKGTTTLDVGDYFFVQDGDTGAGEAYVMTNPVGAFIIGYDNIVFTQFSDSQVYTANTAAGLVLNGTTFSAKVDNSTTAFDGSGNIIVKASANLVTPNIDSATGTSLNLTGNLVSGNVNTGIMSASGNVTGSNILTGGIVSATGNVTGNYFIGNGSQLTGVTASSVDAGALTGNTLSANVIFSSLTTVGSLTSLSVVGTTTTGNLDTAGTVSATGNVIGGNVLTGGYVSSTGNVTGGNLITGGIASVTGTAFAGNISTNGFMSAGGNVTGGNFDTAGNVSATGNVIGGNVLTGGIVSATGTATVGNLNTGGNVSASGNVTGSNILTGGAVSATGNVTGGNLIASGVATVTGTATVGNLATGGTVSATGNVTGGNVLTSGLISAGGNIAAGNVNTTNVSATGNVNAVGFTGGNASVTGNVYAQNFIGNIAGNIDAAGSNTWVQFNDEGDILGASVNFRFDKASNTMTVDGTIQTVTVTATGNVIGGNVSTAGLVTATGNVTGGNLVTGGLATVTGNVIGGNVTTAGLVTATGNVTGGNLVTGGLATVTGNVIGGNVSTAGLVTATGNVTGGNLVTGGLATVTGNVTAGNLLTGGLVSATGNATAANLILTSGTIDGPAAGRIDVNGSGLDTDFAVSGDTTANILYIDAGTGTASFGSSAQTTNAIVAFNATNSILMPVGNTAQRPGTGVLGMLRFNSTGDSLEVYTSGGWEDVGVPAFTVVTSDQFTGNGTQTIFTLSQDSTTAASIVSINGVVQIPTSAYSVSGNLLTFTEAPGPTDVIDARLLTTTTTVAALENSSGNAIVETLDSADTVQITGNLLPVANVTYDLGSPTKMWKNGYFAGNTIYLGNLQLKQAAANTFAVYTSDGYTQADLDVGNIDVSSIVSGTSTIGIAGSGGNAYITIGGTANVLVVSSTLAKVTGDMSVTGNVTAQDVNSLSDAVLKTNIQPLSGVDSVISRLSGVEYDWKNGSGHSYGFLAQEVEKVLPSAVKTGADGLKSINYMMIIPFLVETIKQMGDEIKDLKHTVQRRRGKK